MIKIGKPYIEKNGNLTYLKAVVDNEGEGRKITLFYAVENLYSQYLCHETADAFVLPMLLRAVVSGQDIQIDAPLSEKLYHNLTHSVMYILRFAHQKKSGIENRAIPQIKCNGTINLNFRGEAIGTGCSLGVDGFHVIKSYIFENKEFPTYKPTHLACFNVGAFGSDNTDGTRQSFYNEFEKLQGFSQRFNLPIVLVDTNIHEFYPEHEFNWSASYLNIGCVLSLQKLWNRYLYASGFSLENLMFDFDSSCKSDPYSCPHLSTESVEIVSVDMDKPRSEKVRDIMNDPLCREYLNVCLREQAVNNGIRDRRQSNYNNCGYCEKCLRTILQLDIYGVLDDYKNTFDISRWNFWKPRFLARVIAYRKDDPMYEDILNTIPPEYHIPMFSRLYSKIYKPFNAIRKKITTR